jgi:hypothetical protein
VSKSVTSSEPLRKNPLSEKDITGIEARILAKEARLKTLWGSRLGHQMEALPEYDEAFAPCGVSFVKQAFLSKPPSTVRFE